MSVEAFLSAAHVPRGRVAMRRGLALASAGLVALLAGCDLAPKYEEPKYIYPNGWAGHGVFVDGHPAEEAPRGDWWKTFHDPALDTLEAQMLQNNPDLQSAAEAFTQARDIARETEARLYPQVGTAAGMSDNKTSLTRLWRVPASSAPSYESSVFYSGAATWEPDFWDSIRNQAHMQKNAAQATAAQYALTRLSLEAELASDYIGLRGLDAQLAVYADSIRYYQTAVQITRLRQAGAIAAGIDVSRAENQLYSTMAAQSQAVAERQVLEHAIAVLTNKVPAGFHVASILQQKIPMAEATFSAGLPSTLLERRPDVAMAERRLAASSRAIGVARAAFYPNVTFSASGGFMNNGFDLANMANSMWTVAVQAVEPLFTGGLRRAALQRAWSQYRQTVDVYRGTVLAAFQDVEDGLSQTAQFREQQRRQQEAVEAALRTQKMTMALYTGGLTNYLDVVVAQQAALVARIAEVRAQTTQLQATVRLARALGGGWSRDELPSIRSIEPFKPLQYEGLHHPTPAGGIDPHNSPADNDLGGGYGTMLHSQGLTGGSIER